MKFIKSFYNVFIISHVIGKVKCLSIFFIQRFSPFEPKAKSRGVIRKYPVTANRFTGHYNWLYAIFTRLKSLSVVRVEYRS